jgi:hypothetical protein
MQKPGFHSGNRDGYCDFSRITSTTNPYPSLISLNPGFPIKISKLEVSWNSRLIVDAVNKESKSKAYSPRNRGGAPRVHFSPHEIYGHSAYGKPRKVDNSDLLTGRVQLYDDINHFRHIHSALGDVINDWVPELADLADKGSIPAAIEYQDFKKIHVQRVQSIVSRFHGHFTPGDYVHGPDDPVLARNILMSILRKYIARAGDILKMDTSQLRLSASDPFDSKIGITPTVPVEQTIMGRIMLFNAYDFSRFGVAGVYDGLRNIATQMGVDPFLMTSNQIGYRAKPMKFDAKVPLAYQTSTGFLAQYESSGMIMDSRLIIMVNYIFNYMLSPLYIFFKEARKLIPGLFHRPEDRDKYLRVMQANVARGEISVETDHSAHDNHIYDWFFLMLCDCLRSLKVFPEEVDLLEEFVHNHSVAMPHPNGPGHGTMVVMSLVRQLSGMKLTSEIGSLHNLFTTLYLLCKIDPSYLTKWEKDQFNPLIQGDDCLLTLPKQHVSPFIQKCDAGFDYLGVRLKSYPGVSFLKRYMPLIPEVPTLARLIARFIQQEFFNEEVYSGIPGGDKPDDILLLAQADRLDGIRANPFFHRLWPKVAPIALELGFNRRADRLYHKSVKEARPYLSHSTIEGIGQYALRVPTFAQNLVLKADFNPSAMDSLLLLKKEGLDLTAGVPSQVEVRRLFERSLRRRPAGSDFSKLISNTNWLNRM